MEMLFVSYEPDSDLHNRSTVCVNGTQRYSMEKLWPKWRSAGWYKKHCVRILLGNKVAYLEKKNTCARVRPFEQQILGSDFYKLESTKPLFMNNQILSIHNLYSYHCFTETLKILKLRQPIALFDKYNPSDRKPTLLLSSSSSSDYISRSTSIWNDIAPTFKLADFSVKIGPLKKQLKKALLLMQHRENPKDWTVEDYNIKKILGDKSNLWRVMVMVLRKKNNQKKKKNYVFVYCIPAHLLL